MPRRARRALPARCARDVLDRRRDRRARPRFTVWARIVLGRNWSGIVTVKQDHELITAGPYRWVRHPIYTGLLIAFAGSARSHAANGAACSRSSSCSRALAQAQARRALDDRDVRRCVSSLSREGARADPVRACRLALRAASPNVSEGPVRVSPGAALWSGVRAVALRPPRANPVGSGPGLFVLLIVVYLRGRARACDARSRAAVGDRLVRRDDRAHRLAADAHRGVGARAHHERDEIVWGVAAILLAATIMTSVLVHCAARAGLAAKFAADEYLAFALLAELLSRLWWLLVLIVVAHWLAPRSSACVLRRRCSAYAVSAAMWWWLPAIAAADDRELQNRGTARRDDRTATPIRRWRRRRPSPKTRRRVRRRGKSSTTSSTSSTPPSREAETADAGRRRSLRRRVRGRCGGERVPQRSRVRRETVLAALRRRRPRDRAREQRGDRRDAAARDADQSLAGRSTMSRRRWIPPKTCCSST